MSSSSSTDLVSCFQISAGLPAWSQVLVSQDVLSESWLASESGLVKVDILRIGAHEAKTASGPANPRGLNSIAGQIVLFLAVQNSSIGDLVTDWLTEWGTFDFWT